MREDLKIEATNSSERRSESAGSRIVASVRDVLDWVEGEDVAVRVTKVEVSATRKRPG